MKAVVRKNRRPSRPTHSLSVTRGLTDDIWALIQACWTKDPELRPTAVQVLDCLKGLVTIEDNRPLDSFDNIPRSLLQSSQAQQSPFSFLGEYTGYKMNVAEELPQPEIDVQSALAEDNDATLSI